MKQDRPNLNQDACDELRDLLPAYVIGATTDNEAQRVQQLLLECPEVAEELASYAQITVGLTQQIDPVIPPANLRNKLLEQAKEATIVKMDTPPIRRNNSRIGWGLAAVLVLILLATNIYLLTELQSTNNRLDSLQASNAQITNLLTNQQLQQIALITTDEQSDTRLATLLWDATENTAVLVSDQLTPLDATQTYQLWLIDTAPVSAGIFTANTNNQTLLQVELSQELLGYSAIAISIEPSTGSDAPTTTPIALGEIEA